MNNEYRVYWLSATDIDDVNGVDIENWNGYEVLPDKAWEFIDKAEQKGNVCSFNNFMRQFNIEMNIDKTHWVFITNKHNTGVIYYTITTKNSEFGTAIYANVYRITDGELEHLFSPMLQSTDDETTIENLLDEHEIVFSNLKRI